jgi:hypothetical protein
LLHHALGLPEVVLLEGHQLTHALDHPPSVGSPRPSQPCAASSCRTKWDICFIPISGVPGPSIAHLVVIHMNVDDLPSYERSPPAPDRKNGPKVIVSCGGRGLGRVNSGHISLIYARGNKPPDFMHCAKKRPLHPKDLTRRLRDW